MHHHVDGCKVLHFAVFFSSACVLKTTCNLYMATRNLSARYPLSASHITLETLFMFPYVYLVMFMSFIIIFCFFLWNLVTVLELLSRLK